MAYYRDENGMLKDGTPPASVQNPNSFNGNAKVAATPAMTPTPAVSTPDVMPASQPQVEPSPYIPTLEGNFDAVADGGASMTGAGTMPGMTPPAPQAAQNIQPPQRSYYGEPGGVYGAHPMGQSPAGTQGFSAGQGQGFNAMQPRQQAPQQSAWWQQPRQPQPNITGQQGAGTSTGQQPPPSMTGQRPMPQGSGGTGSNMPVPQPNQPASLNAPQKQPMRGQQKQY